MKVLNKCKCNYYLFLDFAELLKHELVELINFDLQDMKTTTNVPQCPNQIVDCGFAS